MDYSFGIAICDNVTRIYFYLFFKCPPDIKTSSQLFLKTRLKVLNQKWLSGILLRSGRFSRTALFTQDVTCALNLMAFKAVACGLIIKL